MKPADLDYPWNYWDDLVRAARVVASTRDAAHDAALATVEELLGRAAEGLPPLSLDDAARRAVWRALDVRRRAVRAPDTVPLEDAEEVPDHRYLSPEAAGAAAMAELALGRERAEALASAVADGDRRARDRVRRSRNRLKRRT